MESSRSPSSSSQEESLRTLWHKASQWESPTARVITHTRHRAPEESLTPTYLECLLFFNLCALLLFVVIRCIAFFLLCQAIATPKLKEIPWYYFTHLIWTLSLSVDFFFALVEFATIFWFEHFTGTVLFTFRRFAHLAINLKQVIQPEIPENSLVRQELSRFYSLGFVSFHLFFNFLLCYLLSLMLYTKITNRLRGKGDNNCTVTPTTWQPFRWPKRTLLNYTLIVTFLIFLIICWHIYGVLAEAGKAFNSACAPKEHLPKSLQVNDAWTTSLILDGGLIFFELIMVPIAGFLHGTIFFTVIRFVHLAVNLKQVIHPELPENAWLRHQYSGLYSPFYVNLHLFFNVLLSCLLPVYIFQLYGRPKVQSVLTVRYRHQSQNIDE